MLINICICTYRRPDVLLTLDSLGRQLLGSNMHLRVIIADNDEVDSARELIQSYTINSSLDIYYVHAPKNNISLARNACLENADEGADWLAFIDDDEVASPEWLGNLVTCAQQTGSDVVFGPVFAQYPDFAPAWMREGDYHSNIPERRNGIVQTGHTCNALVKWKHKDFRMQRFLLEKGRTGGEDTEFFFRFWRLGAKMEICTEAVVFESIAPERLSVDWIKKRKFRSGQSYAYHSVKNFAILSRFSLGIISVSKITYCFMFTVLSIGNESSYKYWQIRTHFHTGVLAGIFKLTEKELY